MSDELRECRWCQPHRTGHLCDCKCHKAALAAPPVEGEKYCGHCGHVLHSGQCTTRIQQLPKQANIWKHCDCISPRIEPASVTGKPSEVGQWDEYARSKVATFAGQIKNLATNAWLDPKNAEYLFTQIGLRAIDIEDWVSATSSLSARVAELADALRSVNDLQHRMAIELQNIPQEPRIEYWTRQMEDVICKALESAISATPYSSLSELADQVGYWEHDFISRGGPDYHEPRECRRCQVESAIGTPRKGEAKAK